MIEVSLTPLPGVLPAGAISVPFAPDPVVWFGALVVALLVGFAAGRGLRPRAVATHEEDEAFRRLVMQVEGFAIFMMDATGHNRTWNEGVERLLGYGEREWIGH